MPSWIIHEPFTAPTGRDFRPGDTYTADVAPNCDATPVSVDDPDDKPRRGRPPKQIDTDA